MKNKFLLIIVLVFRLVSFPQDIYALPELAEIVSGGADYVFDGNTLTITVHSDQFIANYHSFSIAANEIVRFMQPHVTSTALNRVTGGNSSMIYGVLTSNGIIFLVNPSGINFGPTAQINVGGLVASTLNLSDADFLARDYNFEGMGGFIGVDRGALLSSPGGYVILFSGAIRNDGTIEANLGRIVLATGEEITLELDPLGEISVVIHQAVMRTMLDLDGEEVDSSIENNGKILAQGGKIVINADVLNDIFDHAINNTGIIEAAALIDKGGEIALVAQDAPVSNTGIIEAHDIDIDVIDANMINEGAIIADGNSILTDGGYISIEAKNILQSGTVSANTHEGGTAGDIEIVAEDLLLLDDGSITSAASPVSFLVGEGGNILLNSTEGDTVVLTEAIIDISGGSEAKDAGFVEISAKERIGFYGIINGGAAVGYEAARVLFDPRNITIASGGGDTPTSDIFPGADEASGDHGNSHITIDPLALAAMTAAEIFLQATKDIIINSAISVATSIRFEADRNINVNANVTASGGITMTADADANNDGSFKMAAGTTLSDISSGNITITSADTLTINNLSTIGGDVTVTNNEAGKNLTVNGTIASNGGAIAITAAKNVTTKGAIMSGAGAIAITADSDGSGSGKINLQNLISTTTGTITISSSDVAQIDGLTTQGAAVTITNNDAGGDVNANGSIATNGGALNVTANDNIAFDKTVMTGGGIITVSAGDNVTVSDAMSSGGAAITVTADSNDNNVGDLIVNAAISSGGGAINLKGDDLRLNTGTGSVSGGSGNVTISSSGSNRTLGLGTGGSNFKISDTEFDKISTTGTLQIGDTSTGIMTIGTLTTTTIPDLKLVADDMTITTSLDVGTGDLSLIPADNGRTIGLGIGAASNFNVSDAEMDRITTTGTVTVGDANSGRISVSGLTPVGFTRLNLVSGGNIDDMGAPAAVSINSLTLNGASIGSSSPFNIKVDTLNATATGTISVVEADGAIFGTVTGDGSVTVAITTGNLTIKTGTITSNNAGVDITITNGSILANGAGPHIVADGDSSISLTGGTITTTGTALNVDIGGDLTLDMPDSGIVGGNSGILRGDVSSGGIPLLINTNFPTPQLPAGNILFNGARIWPPAPGVIGSAGGGAILLTARDQSIDGLDRRLEDIYDLNVERHRLSLADAGEPLFFYYHPLTPIDYSAFDDIVLDEEAYEFVENLLKIKEGAPAYFGITVGQ